MGNKSKRKQAKTLQVEEDKDLDRFAGSSDEDDNEDSENEVEEQMAPPQVHVSAVHEDHDADVENDTDEESVDEQGVGTLDDDNQSIDSSSSSIENEVVDPSSKMANAMGRILGGLRKTKQGDGAQKGDTTSIVLGKTVTPLQKLQQQEKEKLKAIKQKRQAKKERNLSALHYPLSIATSNSVQTDGQLSVARELEQERFHRRVATRGVVALFNAISQHQRSSSEQNDASLSSTTKKQEVSKMTKHSFLETIKSTAMSKDAAQNKQDKKRKLDKSEGDEGSKDKKSSSSWSALKEDYLLNPKKNWDEESSDEEGLQTEITEHDVEEKVHEEAPRKKQRPSHRR